MRTRWDCPRGHNYSSSVTIYVDGKTFLTIGEMADAQEYRLFQAARKLLMQALEQQFKNL